MHSTLWRLRNSSWAMRRMPCNTWNWRCADANTSQELAIAITLAQAKLQQKDAKGAEDVLKKACEKSSSPADAMVYLGQFYISQHRTAEAEQQFQRALSVDPRHGVALFDLAKLQYSVGADTGS